MANSTHKLILHAQDFTELKAIPHLREVLVLSYIMNTIRSTQRFLISSEKRSETPTKARDIFFGLVVSASFIYEGMKTAEGIVKKVAVSLPRELHSDIAWLVGEVQHDKSSFFNTILEKLRNGIAFHFNLSISDELLKDAISSFPPVFAEGASEMTVDWSYVLADNLVTQYFAAYDPSAGESDAKVTRAVQRLSAYSDRFCVMLDHAITELIRNHAEGVWGQTAHNSGSNDAHGV